MEHKVLAFILLVTLVGCVTSVPRARCPGVCKNYCPNGRENDSKGCPTCFCKPKPQPPKCGPVCFISCPNGNVLDAKGCPTCMCKPGPIRPPRYG